MISTVTTSTITTVTTTIGFGVVVGVMAVIALLVFLCIKGFATASNNTNHRLLAKSLDVGIVPLLIAFVMIVAMQIVEILV